MTETLEDELEDGGLGLAPVDYVVIEFEGFEPTGEGLTILVDLVERGIIRILDFEVIKRNEDGSVIGLRAEDVSQFGVASLDVFIGASTGILAQDDFDTIGAILRPGTLGAAILYENTWARPFVKHVLDNGGEVIASGRVTVDELAAALGVKED